jgi:AraC-like ligand binding domain
MTDPVTPRLTIGNAGADGTGDTRGWFVGHFVEPSASLRCTDAVEVKWGVHPAGESRSRMAMGTKATTLSILVSGTFRVSFSNREVCLARPGDYVLFPPGVLHGWAAEADSIVITIRWPSEPGDAVEASDKSSADLPPLLTSGE